MTEWIILDTFYYKITHIIVTGSGKIQQFAYSIKIAIFSIYNVKVTSLLSMSIYNCTISELQGFVMQPFILPVLRAVNLHVLILKIEHFSKRWIFADLVTFIIP